MIGISHKNVFFVFPCFLSLIFILDIGNKEATSMARISGVTLHLFLTIYFSFYSSPPYQLYLLSYSTFFFLLVSGLLFLLCCY